MWDKTNQPHCTNLIRTGLKRIGPTRIATPKKYCVMVTHHTVTDGGAWTRCVSEWEGTVLLGETITVISMRKVQAQLAALNFRLPSGPTHC